MTIKTENGITIHGARRVSGDLYMVCSHCASDGRELGRSYVQCAPGRTDGARIVDACRVAGKAVEHGGVAMDRRIDHGND